MTNQEGGSLGTNITNQEYVSMEQDALTLQENENVIDMNDEVILHFK